VPRPGGASRAELGAQGEQAVARWYEDHGYAVVARNWRCRHGELDLVVRQGRLYVFCEVKTRRSLTFGAPVEAVTAAKRARLRRLALAWLEASKVAPVGIRFDVASVLCGAVEVLEGAF
jgi:putative endonuclease